MENAPNYQSDKNYLSFLGHEPENCLFIRSIKNNQVFTMVKKPLFSNYYDAITPIHFQSSSPKFLSNLITGDLARNPNIVSAYFQSRDDLSSIKIDPLVDTSRYRTNYFFDLSEVDRFIPNQSRDARYRLRKAIKNTYYLVIPEKPDLSLFSTLYSNIAIRNSFSKAYLYSHDDWSNLSRTASIKYLEIRNDEDLLLSAGIFGIADNHVDYLYGADSFEVKDSIRVLIYEAAKYFASQSLDRLYLGGGIKEGDHLASFKLRMGTKPSKCSTIRAVLNVDVAEEIMNKKFDKSWFDGYFPPYANLE